MESASALFLDYSVRKLQQLTARIEDCLHQLSDQQIWMRDGESQNAVGNLVLHLSGNVRQWILSGIGNAADTRHRDEEFAARAGQSATELATLLRGTIDEAAALLAGLSPERLAERVQIQAYNVTVLEAVYHVVEHFSGHTGQILFATKLLTGNDLGYYRHLARNAHAEVTP